MEVATSEDSSPSRPAPKNWFVEPKNCLWSAGRPRPACTQQGAKLRSRAGDRRTSPDPRIVQQAANQPSPHWILQHVIKLLRDLLFFPQSAVKGFLLPNFPPPIQRSVDAVSRSTFDSLHDLGERNGPLKTASRYDRKVDVIRHDDQTIEIKLQTASRHTGIHNNRSRGRR